MTKIAAILALVAALVAGCASSGPTIGTLPGQTLSAPATDQPSVTAAPAAITTWFHAVNPKISDVEQSITYAQWMVRHPHHGGLHAACQTLLDDVRTAVAAPPAPDHIARSAIAEELAHFRLAAHQCLGGHLDAAGRSVNRGHHWAQIAGERIVLLLHVADAKR